MKKKSNILSGFNKSTKVTLASCGGFIFLTALILTVFIIFPITPSEKVMASIGRENVLYNGDGGPSQQVTPGGDAAQTTQAAVTTVPYTKRTDYYTTKTVNIVITTGSGFSLNGRIPTGNYNGDIPTTAEDPDTPTVDPGQQYPNPNDPNTNPIDPNQPGEQPTEPTDPNQPGEQPTDPPIDQPVEPPTDPPVAPPVDYPVDPPPENGTPE